MNEADVRKSTSASFVKSVLKTKRWIKMICYFVLRNVIMNGRRKF